MFQGLNKQYANTGIQCETVKAQEASMQTTNKTLQIQNQDCAKFDIKYGYQGYLEKKF